MLGRRGYGGGQEKDKNGEELGRQIPKQKPFSSLTYFYFTINPLSIKNIPWGYKPNLNFIILLTI